MCDFSKISTFYFKLSMAFETKIFFVVKSPTILNYPEHAQLVNAFA